MVRILPFWRAGAAAVFMLMIIAVFPARVCRALPRLGGGMTWEVDRLVHGGAAAHPLPEGWKVANYTFTDFDVNVSLSGPGGARALVRVAYPALPSRRPLMGKTDSFRVELVRHSGSGAHEAAEAFFRRIAANDSPGFLMFDKMRERARPEENIFYRNIFFPALWIMLAAAAVLFVLNLRFFAGRFKPGGRIATVVLAVILVSGAALRVFGSPRAIVHANNHGTVVMRTILYPESPEAKVLLYGVEYSALMRWFSAPFGPGGGGVFTLNLLFGTLSILSMYMLARALCGTDEAALFGALCMSISPLQLLLSGSEAPVELFQFAGLAGLAIACVSIRAGRRGGLALGAILVTLAACLQLLTMTIIPVAIIFCLYVYFDGDGREARKEAFKGLMPLFALCAVWLYFHVSSFSIEKTSEGMQRLYDVGGPIITFYGYKNILGDRLYTAHIVPLLAVAGFIVSSRKWMLWLAMGLVFAAVVPACYTVCECKADALRYQGLAMWLFYLSASMVFFGAKSLTLWEKIRPAAALIAGLLLVYYSLHGIEHTVRGDERAGENTFLETWAPRIPAGTVIRLPAEGEIMLTDFPDYIAGHRIVRGAAPAPPGSQELLYIGVDCYRYWRATERRLNMTASGLRRECASACQGNKSTVAEAALYAPPAVPGYQKRYLALSTFRPVVGFYRCEK